MAAIRVAGIEFLRSSVFRVVIGTQPASRWILTKHSSGVAGVTIPYDKDRVLSSQFESQSPVGQRSQRHGPNFFVDERA